MKNFATCCFVLGMFVLSFGLLSLFIKERLYIAETLVATIYGIVCRRLLESGGSSSAWELKSNLSNSSFIFHFAHIVLSLQLVAVGVTVPKAFMKKNWRSLLVLLLPVMLIMYAVSTVIIKVVCNFDWYIAMIIGACVTPTDPILASTIIKGKFANKYIPSRLRNLLAVESGANDGLGFPLLTMPLLLMQYKRNEAIQMWITRTWGLEICLALVLGGIIGLFARFLLKYSMRRFLIDKESFLVYLIALALLVTGAIALLKSDDLLAVSIAGVVFAWDEELVEDIKNSHVMEVVDLIFNQTFFIVFGFILLEKDIFNVRNMLAAVLIIILRRLPAVLLMKALHLLPKYNMKELFFAGWFGPIGVGALFFAHHAEHEIGEGAVTESILKLVYGIVFVSIVVHGTTAPIIHLHMKRRQRKREREESMYESDTEAEKDFDLPSLQQII